MVLIDNNSRKNKILKRQFPQPDFIIIEMGHKKRAIICRAQCLNLLSFVCG